MDKICGNCNSNRVVIRKSLIFDLDFDTNNALLGHHPKHMFAKVITNGQLWWELKYIFYKIESNNCKCINKICLDCGYTEPVKDKKSIYFKNLQGDEDSN